MHIDTEEQTNKLLTEVTCVFGMFTIGEGRMLPSLLLPHETHVCLSAGVHNMCFALILASDRRVTWCNVTPMSLPAWLLEYDGITHISWPTPFSGEVRAQGQHSLSIRGSLIPEGQTRHPGECVSPCHWKAC